MYHQCHSNSSHPAHSICSNFVLRATSTGTAPRCPWLFEPKLLVESCQIMCRWICVDWQAILTSIRFLFSQSESTGDDELLAIAGSPNDTVVLAGYTTGDWSATNAGGQDFATARVVPSFSGTQSTSSPTTNEESAPESESETSGGRSILIPLSIVLSMIALLVILACRAKQINIA